MKLWANVRPGGISLCEHFVFKPYVFTAEETHWPSGCSQCFSGRHGLQIVGPSKVANCSVAGGCCTNLAPSESDATGWSILAMPLNKIYWTALWRVSDNRLWQNQQWATLSRFEQCTGAMWNYNHLESEPIQGVVLWGCKVVINSRNPLILVASEDASLGLYWAYIVLVRSTMDQWHALRYQWRPNLSCFSQKDLLNFNNMKESGTGTERKPSDVTTGRKRVRRFLSFLFSSAMLRIVAYPWIGTRQLYDGSPCFQTSST
jgi:hypothetical protein